jgi:hypothetical protein
MDSYNSVRAVHEHLEAVNDLILKLVDDENAAVVLACQVFQDHSKLVDPCLFQSTSEGELGWLEARAIEVSARYLKRKKREQTKTKDHPGSFS